MIKQKMITLSIIAALSMPFIANAENNTPPQPSQSERGAPPRPDMNPQFRFSPFEGIQLTEEQKQKIDIIRKEGRQGGKKDIFKDGFAAEKRVRELVTSEEYSKAKVESIVREATEKLVAVSVARADQEHKIFEVLNTVQKEKYKENISNFEKKIKERKSPHFNEDRTTPPPQEK